MNLRDGFVSLARSGCSHCGGTDRALECLTKALGSFPRLPPRVPPNARIEEDYLIVKKSCNIG